MSADILRPLARRCVLHPLLVHAVKRFGAEFTTLCDNIIEERTVRLVIFDQFGMGASDSHRFGNADGREKQTRGI